MISVYQQGDCEICRSNGPASFVIDVLELGYKMHLFPTPKTIELKNNKPAVNNEWFVPKETESQQRKALF